MNLMTRQEVADHYGVSLWTIINWEKKGFLKTKRVGRAVMYYRSEVLKKPKEKLLYKRIK